MIQGLIPKDRYIAGLWLDDIHLGLLWQVQKPQKSKATVIFSGPSWSWTGVGQPSYIRWVGLMSFCHAGPVYRVLEVQDTQISCKIDANPYESFNNA